MYYLCLNLFKPKDEAVLLNIHWFIDVDVLGYGSHRA